VRKKGVEEFLESALLILGPFFIIWLIMIGAITLVGYVKFVIGIWVLWWIVVAVFSFKKPKKNK
jgi:hypothetical protein